MRSYYTERSAQSHWPLTVPNVTTYQKSQCTSYHIDLYDRCYRYLLGGIILVGCWQGKVDRWAERDMLNADDWHPTMHQRIVQTPAPLCYSLSSTKNDYQPVMRGRVTTRKWRDENEYVNVCCGGCMSARCTAGPVQCLLVRIMSGCKLDCTAVALAHASLEMLPFPRPRNDAGFIGYTVSAVASTETAITSNIHFIPITSDSRRPCWSTTSEPPVHRRHADGQRIRSLSLVQYWQRSPLYISCLSVQPATRRDVDRKRTTAGCTYPWRCSVTAYTVHVLRSTGMHDSDQRVEVTAKARIRNTVNSKCLAVAWSFNPFNAICSKLLLFEWFNAILV